MCETDDGTRYTSVRLERTEAMNENETTTAKQQRRANKKRWFARLSLLGTRAERASTSALVMAGSYTSNRAMTRASNARVSKRTDCQRAAARKGLKPLKHRPSAPPSVRIDPPLQSSEPLRRRDGLTSAGAQS